MPATLYGIPHCDTVKKARTWLDAHGIDYVFHDFKKAGIQPGLIDLWLRDVAWETLINRKGATWRALTDEQKALTVDAATATELILASPSIVKRPVLHIAGATYVGFSEQTYQQIFQD